MDESEAFAHLVNLKGKRVRCTLEDVYLRWDIPPGVYTPVPFKIVVEGEVVMIEWGPNGALVLIGGYSEMMPADQVEVIE